MLPDSTHCDKRLPLGDWVQLRIEFAWAYEGVVPEAYRHASSHYPGASALLIRKGGILVRTPKGEVHAQEGKWIFPTTGQRLQSFSDNTEILSIHFHSTWPGGQTLFNWPVAVVVDSLEHRQLEIRAKRLERLVSRHFAGAGSFLHKAPATILDAMLLQSCFSAWFYTYLEILLGLGFAPMRLNEMDPRVLQAVHSLDHLQLNAKFDETDFAAEIGLGPSQLNRLFFKEFSLTPRRYFERRKFAQATDALCSCASIKEIAFDLGFSSLPHFSGWFRKRSGFSPREFRADKDAAKRAQEAIIRND